MTDRLARLRRTLEAQGLDALLVSQPENRRYLSGFTGSSGVLIVSLQQQMLATDFRYYEQVRIQAPEWDLLEVTDSVAPVLARALRDLGAARVGFESHDVTVECHAKWAEAMDGVELVPLSGVVEKLRQVKDPFELDCIQRAVEIADAAMEHIYGWIRPGVSEREVAWELEVYMRTHGAEALSFPTIVASGPQGAMAHARPGDRVIAAGEPIVIDMGCVYEGYCSDLTRSFCLGKADAEYRDRWELVLQAQQAAEEGIRAGMGGKEADAIARDIICGAGYEGQFGHGLGHGVGLAIHEDPRASRTYEDSLPSGTVLTVEPGIYIPGWGGIRIEDMVVVMEDGCLVLTGCAKVPVVGA